MKKNEEEELYPNGNLQNKIENEISSFDMIKKENWEGLFNEEVKNYNC